MKPLLLLALPLLAAFFSFSQTDESESDGSRKRLRAAYQFPHFERSFGVAYETGGNFSLARTQGGYAPSDWKVNTTKVNGCSVFYRQQVNRRQWGFSFGLGVGAMFAEYNLKFSNPEVLVINEPGGGFTTINFKDQKDHFITETAMPLMLEIPLAVSHAFRLRERSILRPYVGIRIRNIVYVGNQLSEQYYGRSLGGGSDTTFSGHISIDYGTKWPVRILGFANLGVEHSYMLKNGGSLNGFVEYNLPVFNQFQVRLSDFNTEELVWMYNESTGDYEQVYYDFQLYPKGWPYQFVALAFRMSTVRVGVSYSFPSKTRR